jgi:hypothetical protein
VREKCELLSRNNLKIVTLYQICLSGHKSSYAEKEEIKEQELSRNKLQKFQSFVVTLRKISRELFFVFDDVGEAVLLAEVDVEVGKTLRDRSS